MSDRRYCSISVFFVCSIRFWYVLADHGDSSTCTELINPEHDEMVNIYDFQKNLIGKSIILSPIPGIEPGATR